MARYYLGYATAKGVQILKVNEDESVEIIIVSSVKIGNMMWPSPREMGEFIAALSAEDVFVSPSGPNTNFLAGAYRRGAEVRWINPALLRDKLGEKKYTPELLRQFFEIAPESFYTYGEDDLHIAKLGVAYAGWMRTEAERIAVSNSLDQSLRRELEFFAYYVPDREKWVNEKAERIVNRLRGSLRRGKTTIAKGRLNSFRITLVGEFRQIYDLTLRGNTKDFADAQRRLKELEMASIVELEEEEKKEAEEYLKELPHNEIFAEVSGAGPRTKAGALVHIGNPLLFPTFAHLASYAGMRVVGGQAIRRYDPIEKRDLRYNHEHHKVACFDFGDKAHYHDGIFKELYYAYKCQQYLIYWPLMELTAEVQKYWSEDIMDIKHGMGTNGEEPEKLTQEKINDWARRLGEMTNPMMDNPRVKKAIADLAANPSWVGLKKIISRAKGCLNIQMDGTRVEAEAKRMNGITLFRLVYYRWLQMLSRPLPLETDHIYVSQWKKLYGKNGEAGPKEYDPLVTVAYYQLRCEELQREGRTLPEEVWTAKAVGDKEPKERFPGLRLG